MSFDDPFYGYSLVVRAILFGAVPLFAVWQFVRLRRALHVFQLEGYKRARFLAWCRANRRRALFLQPATAKKPLVMTGRAWRILVTATVLSVLVVLGATGAAHLAGGWPFDVATWAVATTAVFVGVPWVLAAGDLLLAPVQRAINGRYLRAARREIDEIAPTIVAVAGSFGKTSTKFAIAGLLGDSSDVLATPGSYNTPLGVCRTVNELLEPEHRFFVVEIGAYREGEIAELCRFVRPHIGVLTAIGPAHLERFGSMDVIRRAKYEIIRSLPDSGIGVMNVDDPEVRAFADQTTGPSIVRYGLDPEGRPDLTATDLTVGPSGTRFTIVDTRTGEAEATETRLLGRHSIGHVLAAVAVGRAADIALSDLCTRVTTLAPVEHRVQLIEGAGGVTVIDDAFNSNPDGAEAALEVLDAMPGNRKVIVTPGIVELGPLQFEANKRLGERAAKVADTVVVVARVNRDALVAGAETAGSGAEIVVVDSLEGATAALRGLLASGDVVLFENDLPDQYEH